MNQILFCTQSLQSQPITINFVLGSEHYQGQEDRSLTTTVKGSSRNQQWAQGQPSVSSSSMGRQPPLHTERTLQPRESKLYSLLIRNISPDPKMREGLVYSDSENSTPPLHSLAHIHSPSHRLPLGQTQWDQEILPEKKANWLRYCAACHRGAGRLLSPAGVLWSPGSQ